MEHIKQLFLDFIGTYNVKEEDLTKEGGYSGALTYYSFLKNIFKIYKLIILKDESKAIFQFKESIEKIDFTIDMDNSTDEEIQIALKRRSIVKEIKYLYSDVKEEIYNPLIELTSKHDFFKDETLEGISEEIILNVHDWMDNNHLSKYVLKQGSSKIPKDLSNFIISKDFYLCDNLNYFLTNFNKTYDDDVVRVTTFFKIEKVVDYSYFMFILNYKDHTIAFSDLLTFDNPNMANSSRSPRRKVEDKQDNCWLPYNLIDEISDIRKDDTTLNILDNDVEFHKLKWNRFSQNQRMYILLVIEQLVNKLGESKGTDLISAGAYYEQKLLTGEKIEDNPWENEDFTNWNEHTKTYAKDLFDNLDENDSTELATLTYDLVVKSDLYDETLLAPRDIHEKHSKWFAVNVYKHNIQKTLGKRLYMVASKDEEDRKRYDDGKEYLTKSLNSKFESIIRKLTITENLSFVTAEKSFKGGSGRFGNDLVKEILCFRFRRVKEEDPDDYILGFSNIGSRYGYYPYNAEEEKCLIDPRYKGSTQYCFTIKHYSQLMYLLDCTREELPVYFRSYRSSSMIPYSGNPILNNVHPLATLTDACSQQHPNGILIGIHMSKRGFNKIVKENGGKNRPKELAVDINGKIYDDLSNFEINNVHQIIF